MKITRLKLKWRLAMKPLLKSVLFLIWIILNSILSNRAFAFNYIQSNQKTNIAVIDLFGLGISSSDLYAMTNRLRSELFNTGEFTVFERERMDEIFKEQGFQQSGCTTTECAIEAGKLLNVNYVVIGSIDKVSNLYSINIRLVNVETAKIENIETEDCSHCTIEDFYLTSIRRAARKFAGLKVESTFSRSNKSPENSIKPLQASLLSFFLPGTGLILSKNYLMAAIYFTSSVGLYIGGGALASSPDSEKNGHAMMMIGGAIHLSSIIHTVISSNKYNITLQANFKHKYIGFTLVRKL